MNLDELIARWADSGDAERANKGNNILDSVADMG